jgi:hopanoid biosynthesis associated RND transporter like protein HpnN
MMRDWLGIPFTGRAKAMHGLNLHPVERLLHYLADCIWRWPRWFLYPQIALFIFSAIYAGCFLKFKTDVNDLVSSDVSYQRNWQVLQRDFNVGSDIVTLVESTDREKNRQFVERLAARVKAETNLFVDIFYKGDLRSMGPKALLLLPEDKLEQILAALRDYQPLVGKFSDVTNLNSLFIEVQAQWRAGAGSASSSNLFVQALPALTRIVEQGRDSLLRSGAPPSPGMATLFAPGDESAPGGYLQVGGGRFYLLTCAARNPAVEEQAILRLRELVEAIRTEVPGVNAGVTGEPVLSFDEMRQAQSDTATASVIALVVVALTFIYCYNELLRPLKATACLLVGIGYTLAFATLTIGHLNILTITFVPILIGMAIDFGVHLIARYEEELREGRPERMAIQKALVATGTGIFTSGLTTAGAFLAMILTSFKGIREMGVISGGGLLICLVPMMTMLPALLLMRRGPVREQVPHPRRQRSHGHARRERLEQVWLRRPRFVAWTGAVITILAVLAIPGLVFDYNVLNMQSQSLQGVVFERRIEAASSHSVLSCDIIAPSLADAIDLEQRIRRLGTVADVDTVAPLIAADQSRKLALVRQITEAAAAIDFAPMDGSPVDVPALDQTLKDFGRGVVGAMLLLGDAAPALLKARLYTLREAIGQWREAMAHMTPEACTATLTQYQQALFNDLHSTLTALKEQDYREPLRGEDLPPALRSRFVGRSGKYLLQVYSRGNLWEHETQQAFVRELRTIDPSVTGTPVRFYENTRRIKSSFQTAAGYAVTAIALMLFLHFRNGASVLLALIPVAVGIVWTFGLMVLLGIPFNPANIIAPTLLIGIGVANGIHILNRFIEEKRASFLGKSTGKAVLVSALTTATGFGSLMFAKHAGIASLGKVMALGSALCMIAALTILPALLILLTRTKLRLGHGWLSR